MSYFKNDPYDLSSNLNDIAPSHRKFKFLLIYVAFIKFVFSRATVSFSPFI